ncbi:signal peptidase I [Enterococcus sp. LJL128]|uniref:signal peptidase I n=1 Tax=Enterococcus sp. LJL51 TaxID=3416656 RepID=UPI003CE839D5
MTEKKKTTKHRTTESPDRKRPFVFRGKEPHQILKNVFFLFFVIGAFLFFIYIGTHVVSGESMAPTFANGDRVFVRKGAAPERYAIITFHPEEEKNETYVKRVIGMPGDVIWLEENKLFINHQMKTNNPVASNTDKRAIDLPDGTVKVNITVDVEAQLKNMKTIPAGHYFVLGDNRNHSTDSRWLGLIKDEQIEGVVVFRYFPFTKLGGVR